MPSSIPALLNKPLDFWKYTTEETKVRLELKSIFILIILIFARATRMDLLKVNFYIEQQMEELKVCTNNFSNILGIYKSSFFPYAI